jgi:glycosyltransferase involved in cell wall biosynthesis/GT2 family glycosyltransferase
MLDLMTDKAMIDHFDPDFTLTPVHPERRHFGYSYGDLDVKPQISIVTPFYNTGPEFYQTAQSVFQQSLQQFEWLIINDGSNDPQSLQILESYRHLDPRIRVIDHPANLGLSTARNTGFRHAQTEFVALLDSDDLLEPTAIEKWWWFLETQPQFGFVASYHVAFEGKSYLWTGGFHDGAQNAERNHVSMICMIRKSVHQKVGGFDESIRGGLEDWEFWMRCASQGIWGATVPEYLAWYRLRSDHSDRWQNLQEERIAEFRSRFQQEYPHLYSGKFPDPSLRNFELDLTLVLLEVPLVNQLAKPNRRVLFILPWLVMGGAERFALNLIDQLQQRGWQVTVVATSSADQVWLYDFEKRSEDVFILPNFLPVKDYPRFLGYLIYSRHFDAVFLQGSHEGYRLIPILHSLYPNLPIVDYLHFITPEWMQGGFPRLSLLYQDNIDLTITSSQHLRNWMLKEGRDPQKLQVCYIGVDPEKWKPDKDAHKRVRSEFGIGLEETVILYAARLEYQKQPFLMLKVIEKLLNDGISFRVLIAGDGSLRPALEQKIKEANLNERVLLLGSVPTEKMPSVMAAADIYFLPSSNEGIAQAIYEAMSCGLVVVGANVGGQEELVTPDSGLLIDVDEEEILIEKYAHKLTDLIVNPKLRNELGIQARQRIQEGFTLDVMGETIAGAFTTLSNRPIGTPAPAKITGIMIEHARIIVEFLQARQESLRLYGVIEQVSNQYRELFRQFETLVIAKSPSYWFYLWIRQLFLPLYNWIMSKTGNKMLSLKDRFKRLFIR